MDIQNIDLYRSNGQKKEFWDSEKWRRMMSYMTHADVALVFSSLQPFCDNIRFCRQTKTWYVCNNGIWCARTDNAEILIGLKELRYAIDNYLCIQRHIVDKDTSLTADQKKAELAKIKKKGELYTKLGVTPFLNGVISAAFRNV